MNVPAPAVGSRIRTWFSGDPDGKSLVLKVEPYRGSYPQWFKWTVRVSAPRTQRGWMEICL